MNKCVPLLVCAAAALTLTTFASSADRPSGNNRNHYVAYQQEDANSIVETESDSEGTYDVFYDRLAPEGRWFYDDDYGYVWQPNAAESTSNWRPYTDGHWVWTDRGWFWDSNEDFGWATYHYGRWVMVAGVGWVWIPGDQWAPAWVSWRQTDDDDYVGWAPLPPEATFSVNVGFHPWCDNYYDIGPAAFAFIRIVDFGRPSYREFCAPPQQNLVLIKRTTNVTNITYNNNVIYNNGPQYQRVSQLVQQRTGQQIPAYKVNYAAQARPNGAFKTAAQGKQLNVIAPPQRLKPIATVQPQVAKQLGKAQVERGWQNVPQGQAQQIRHQFAQQAPVPQTLPPKPVLPNKSQIQALTKGQPPKAETPAPGGSAKVQQGANGKLQPFIEKSGNNATTEQQKLEQQKLEAQKENGQIQKGENVKSVEPAKKPEVATEQGKVASERANGQHAEKAQVEHKQQGAINAEHIPQKQATHEESPKGKTEVPKKELPTPPQAKVNQHAQYAVAHPQPQYHAQQQVHRPQPHVAQAPHLQPHPPAQRHIAQAPHPQPHPPPQPHRAASNNGQKQNNGHKKG
jgi:hypothetical protein